MNIGAVGHYHPHNHLKPHPPHSSPQHTHLVKWSCTVEQASENGALGHIPLGQVLVEWPCPTKNIVEISNSRDIPFTNWSVRCRAITRWRSSQAVVDSTFEFVSWCWREHCGDVGENTVVTLARTLWWNSLWFLEVTVMKLVVGRDGHTGLLINTQLISYVRTLCLKCNRKKKYMSTNFGCISWHLWVVGINATTIQFETHGRSHISAIVQSISSVIELPTPSIGSVVVYWKQYFNIWYVFAWQ